MLFEYVFWKINVAFEVRGFLSVLCVLVLASLVGENIVDCVEESSLIPNDRFNGRAES